MTGVRSVIAAVLAMVLVSAPVLAADPAPAPPPDYALPANWSAAAAVVPEGATPAARAPAVDVFFIHPTTLRSETLLNADPAEVEANRWVDESSIARQASVFNGCCRVFAPRYRAASYKALASAANRDAGFALAYGDIERAFDWYLANENHGRPFILAGHSQGAFHTATLLEKRIDGTPLQKQLVAAYIVGINLSEGDFGRRFKQVKVCDKPAQTGCVLQWEALTEGSDVARMAGFSQSTFVAKYGDVPGKQTVCINPVTFDSARPASPAKVARGAVPGAPGFGAVRPLVAGKVAARCEQGLLVVSPDPALDVQPLPGGSMHYHDFGLFYADVRADAVRRARAFQRATRR